VKFSVGLLSWKRVSNIRQIVDEYIFHDDLIDEIIIWNNNPEEHLEFGEGYEMVKVVNCLNPDDFGLITRFCMGSRSKNQMILLQDDDYILPEESLIRLRDEWMNEPKRFHTWFGRNPKPNGDYADEVLEGDAEICGRCYVIDRKYCGLILHEYHNLSEDERRMIHSKGDDILASYVVSHYTGQLHSVHNIPHIPLDESYALSYGESRPMKPMELENALEMDAWYQDRKVMMDFCKRRYE
jgi:hypothetical protein